MGGELTTSTTRTRGIARFLRRWRVVSVNSRVRVASRGRVSCRVRQLACSCRVVNSRAEATAEHKPLRIHRGARSLQLLHLAVKARVQVMPTVC